MRIYYGPLILNYIPKNIPLIYNKCKYTLTDEAELIAILFAQIPTDLKDKVFLTNFHKSFIKIAPFCKTLSKCDFSVFDGRSPSFRNTPKSDLKLHTHCIINNKKVKVANHIVEPTSIFKGRGDHPLRGSIKFQVLPKDVTVNSIKKLSDFPVVSDDSVSWIACYKDSLGTMKYIYPVYNDAEIKFETARKLKKFIKKIRLNVIVILSDPHSSPKYKQLASATWLIDKLLIRIGNEKNCETSADTVGICTLRVEHIKFLQNSHIRLDFLGKDSIRFNKKVKLPAYVYTHLCKIASSKKSTDTLFDIIDSESLNRFLSSCMPDLTAKVFRTYHASNTFQNLLSKSTTLKEYKTANVKIGEICNHVSMRSGKLTVSQNTSKTNYIDPRITYAFSRKHNISVDELFSASLQKHHSWASNTPASFVF